MASVVGAEYLAETVADGSHTLKGTRMRREQQQEELRVAQG